VSLTNLIKRRSIAEPITFALRKKERTDRKDQQRQGLEIQTHRGKESSHNKGKTDKRNRWTNRQTL